MKIGARTEGGIDCPNCKFIVPLMPENEEAVELIGKVAAGLFAGGRVNYRAVESAFNIYDVAEEDRPALFEKFQVYIEVMMEHFKQKD